jgi:hypothetical protein
MKINWQVVGSVLLVTWLFIKRWIDNISTIIEPLAKEVEAMAHDGLIDKAERKQLVMKAVSLLEAQGKLKLNFITRFVVDKIADDIARNLPDFKVSAEAKQLIAQAKE